MATTPAQLASSVNTAPEVVALNVTVGGGATTLTGAATIFGYLI